MKVFKIILWCLVFFFLIINVTYFGFTLLLTNASTQKEIQENFIENKSHFNNIIINFRKSEGDISLYADDFNDKLTVFDRECTTSMEVLFSNNYIQCVKKSGNFVYFQMGSAKDFSQGIVFSEDGQLPYINLADRINFSIIESNWYYYEIVD